MALTGDNVAIVSRDADVTNRNGYSLRNSGVNVMGIRKGKVRHVRVFIFAPSFDAPAWRAPFTEKRPAVSE